MAALNDLLLTLGERRRLTGTGSSSRVRVDGAGSSWMGSGTEGGPFGGPHATSTSSSSRDRHSSGGMQSADDVLKWFERYLRGRIEAVADSDDDANPDPEGSMASPQPQARASAGAAAAATSAAHPPSPTRTDEATWQARSATMPPSSAMGSPVLQQALAAPQQANLPLIDRIKLHTTRPRMTRHQSSSLASTAADPVPIDAEESVSNESAVASTANTASRQASRNSQPAPPTPSSVFEGQDRADAAVTDVPSMANFTFRAEPTSGSRSSPAAPSDAPVAVAPTRSLRRAASAAQLDASDLLVAMLTDQDHQRQQQLASQERKRARIETEKKTQLWREHGPGGRDTRGRRRDRDRRD